MSAGFLVTSEKGNTNWPGYPLTMFLICTEHGINLSFFAKNISIEVISIPPCVSTKNDCASGSPHPLISPPFKI